MDPSKRAGSAALLVLLVGCGSVTAAREAPSVPIPAVRLPSLRQQAQRREPPPRYAPSPVTDLAEAVTHALLAAPEGRSPPSGPVAFDFTRMGCSTTAAPRGSELEILAFGMDLYVVLEERPEPDSMVETPCCDSRDYNALSLQILLRGTGLVVSEAAPAIMAKPQPLPAWLSGAAEVGLALVEAIRSDRLSQHVLGASERSELCRRGVLSQPDGDPEAELAAAVLVRRHSRPAGVVVDHLSLLARGPEGELWVVGLAVRQTGGGTELVPTPWRRVDPALPPDHGLRPDCDPDLAGWGDALPLGSCQPGP